MAGEIDLSAINGLTKKVYDKSGLGKFLPTSSIVQKAVTWENGTRNIGEAFQISVPLRMPNGFSYIGTAGGVTTLKNPRNMLIKQASITPFEMDLREQAGFAALSRAAEQGEGSFASLATTMFKAMKQSASTRLEIAQLHGQRGLGVVEAVTDLGSSQMDITIDVATWAPGLWWAIGEGATLDSFTSTTKNNATGVLITAGVKASERKITVTHSGTFSSEVAAGDVLYFEGAWDGTTYTEMPGVLAQSANLTGTSLGLSATTYSQWKGNTYDVAGNLSSDVVELCASGLRDRGVSGRLSLLVCNKGYSVLMNELKQLRVIDSSYSPEKGKQGHKSVAYYSPDIGEIEVVNHSFMKQGEFWLGDFDVCARVGSADITFGAPGTGHDNPVWERVPNTNAVEVVLFTDQCVAVKEPSKCLTATGITYT